MPLEARVSVAAVVSYMVQVNYIQIVNLKLVILSEDEVSLSDIRQVAAAADSSFNTAMYHVQVHSL